MVHCMFFILVFEVIFLWCDLKLWGLKDRVWSSIFFIGFSFQIGETAPSLLVEEAELLRNYREGSAKTLIFETGVLWEIELQRGVEIATPTKFCGLLKCLGCRQKLSKVGWASITTHPWVPIQNFTKTRWGCYWHPSLLFKLLKALVLLLLILTKMPPYNGNKLPYTMEKKFPLCIGENFNWVIW